MADSKPKRRAVRRTKAITLDKGPYEGWVFVAWTNPPWYIVEGVFQPPSLFSIRENLEQIVVGPWNFVDTNGDPVGEPYEGEKPVGEGPWSMPVPSQTIIHVDEPSGIEMQKILNRGSLHMLPPDLIRSMIEVLQTELTALPN